MDNAPSFVSPLVVSGAGPVGARAATESRRALPQTPVVIYGDEPGQLDPAVRPMFKGGMQEQGRKLMKMLGTVVNSLTRLDELVPVAQDMAKRHVGYGVQPAHYDTVGAALLWTLEQGLGSAFTDDTRDAWAAAYGTLAGVMKEAAYAPA